MTKPIVITLFLLSTVGVVACADDKPAKKSAWEPAEIPCSSVGDCIPTTENPNLTTDSSGPAPTWEGVPCASEGDNCPSVTEPAKTQK